MKTPKALHDFGSIVDYTFDYKGTQFTVAGIHQLGFAMNWVITPIPLYGSHPLLTANWNGMSIIIGDQHFKGGWAESTGCRRFGSCLQRTNTYLENQDGNELAVRVIGPEPRPPIPLSVTRPGGGGYRLDWGGFGSGDLVEWQYRYKTEGTGAWGAWTDVPGSTGTTRHYDLTSLDYAYSFQVRGVNSDGIGSNTSEASGAADAERNFIPESGGGLWASDRTGGSIDNDEFVYNGTTYRVNYLGWRADWHAADRYGTNLCIGFEPDLPPGMRYDWQSNRHVANESGLRLHASGNHVEHVYLLKDGTFGGPDSKTCGNYDYHSQTVVVRGSQRLNPFSAYVSLMLSGPAQAETDWSGMMTVGLDGGTYGYFDRTNLSIGSMTNDDFTWYGRTYTVKAAGYVGNGPNTVELDLDQPLPTSLARGLTLHVYDSQYPNREYPLTHKSGSDATYHVDPKVGTTPFIDGRTYTIKLSHGGPPPKPENVRGEVHPNSNWGALVTWDMPDHSGVGKWQYRIRRHDGNWIAKNPSLTDPHNPGELWRDVYHDYSYERDCQEEDKANCPNPPPLPTLAEADEHWLEKYELQSHHSWVFQVRAVGPGGVGPASEEVTVHPGYHSIWKTTMTAGQRTNFNGFTGGQGSIDDNRVNIPPHFQSTVRGLERDLRSTTNRTLLIVRPGLPSTVAGQDYLLLIDGVAHKVTHTTNRGDGDVWYTVENRPGFVSGQKYAVQLLAPIGSDPSAPDNFKVIEATHDSILVGWDARTDATSYRIELRKFGTRGWGAPQNTIVDGNATSERIDVEPGIYNVRMFVRNYAGESANGGQRMVMTTNDAKVGARLYAIFSTTITPGANGSEVGYRRTSGQSFGSSSYTTLTSGTSLKRLSRDDDNVYLQFTPAVPLSQVNG